MFKHHTMKTGAGVEIYLHAFLTSIIDTGELSAIFSVYFPPGIQPPERTGWN
jgi:hypothetical protein